MRKSFKSIVSSVLNPILLEFCLGADFKSLLQKIKDGGLVYQQKTNREVSCPFFAYLRANGWWPSGSWSDETNENSGEERERVNISH